MIDAQLSLFDDQYFSDAVFSPCRKYRYALWRIWDKSKGICTFIGLNPSTATETIDDPTIRRCINYAKDWGYGGFCMANIFAFRATDPKVMKIEPDPVGPQNDWWLKELAQKSAIMIAAWGTHGSFRNRQKEVMELLDGKLYCLEVTKGGFPNHPLYLRKDLKPKLFVS